MESSLRASGGPLGPSGHIRPKGVIYGGSLGLLEGSSGELLEGSLRTTGGPLGLAGHIRPKEVMLQMGFERSDWRVLEASQKRYFLIDELVANERVWGLSAPDGLREVRLEGLGGYNCLFRSRRVQN